MTPADVAEKYLQGRDYIGALRLLLGQLNDAWERRARKECDFLCDVMIELQILSGNFEGAQWWRCTPGEYRTIRKARSAASGACLATAAAKEFASPAEKAARLPAAAA